MGKENQIGKPVFYQKKDEKRNKKGNEERIEKRGEQAVDKNGMRLSISNNMDVLRDKLFTAINSNGGKLSAVGGNAKTGQSKMTKLKEMVAVPNHQALLLLAARNRAKQRFFVSPKDSLRKYRRNSQQIFKNRMQRMSSPISLPIHHIG